MTDISAWKALATKDLKGSGPDTLNRTTPEGLTLKALYTRDDLPEGGAADTLPGIAGNTPFDGLPVSGRPPRPGQSFHSHTSSNCSAHSGSLRRYCSSSLSSMLPLSRSDVAMPRSSSRTSITVVDMGLILTGDAR